MNAVPAPPERGNSAAIHERARQVRLLILDVDGVLTDGNLYYGDDGSEIKAFYAQDGSAIKRLLAAGVAVAIISGRRSLAVRRRVSELGIGYLYEGIANKAAALAELSAKSKVESGHMAHVGDDLPDIALFERVGLACAVPGSHPAVLRQAHYVTTLPGGQGAVREVCDLILGAQSGRGTCLRHRA